VTKLCRFRDPDGSVRIGAIDGDEVLDLTAAGAASITEVLESPDPAGAAGRLAAAADRRRPLAATALLAPVEGQEIWAAGVTYLRSRAARMEESEFSASAYGRVYEAPRPELFFKSLPEKAVGPGEPVGIRRDAGWSVPEPELALVLSSRGSIAGFTIGNDMSSRDIEGENLLYLPQAKIYDRSCAVGPCIVLGAGEAEARTWSIGLAIRRYGVPVFEGRTSAGNIKRPFAELAGYLFRSQSFPRGALILTGTGIVPEGNFSLAEGDQVRIEVSGIGVLENPVVTV